MCEKCDFINGMMQLDIEGVAQSAFNDPKAGVLILGVASLDHPNIKGPIYMSTTNNLELDIMVLERVLRGLKETQAQGGLARMEATLQ